MRILLFMIPKTGLYLVRLVMLVQLCPFAFYKVSLCRKTYLPYQQLSAGNKNLWKYLEIITKGAKQQYCKEIVPLI